MAGVRPLTEEEKKLISLYGKPVTVYDFLQAFSRDKPPSVLPRCLSYKIEAKKNKMTNPGGIAIYNYMDECNNRILRSEVKRRTSCPFCPMKCGSLRGVKHHLTSSHALLDFTFRLSENGHPSFDVSVKPDAFENGVLTYDLEDHPLVDYAFYRSKSRMRGQVHGRKGRKICNIFEKYSDYVPRDNPNELPHENGNISSSLARSSLSEETSDIQTITQPEMCQSSKAKGPPAIGIGRKTLTPCAIGRKKLNPRAIGRKKLNPQRVQDERWFYTPRKLQVVPLKDRQFYHSRTLQPMTMDEVLSDADSDDENDQDFKNLIERMKLDRLVDASDEDKRFMWLWNRFIDEQRVLADKHVPWACVEFIKVHAKELITSKLIWHWRKFAVDILCIKYGLINAKTMDKCSIILQYTQEGKEVPEEVLTADEVAAAAEAEAAAEARALAKVAKAAAAAAAASNCKATRKSTRILEKKQQGASASKANASGNKPQPMELDEAEH